MDELLFLITVVLVFLVTVFFAHNSIRDAIWYGLRNLEKLNGFLFNLLFAPEGLHQPQGFIVDPLQ